MNIVIHYSRRCLFLSFPCQFRGQLAKPLDSQLLLLCAVISSTVSDTMSPATSSTKMFSLRIDVKRCFGFLGRRISRQYRAFRPRRNESLMKRSSIFEIHLLVLPKSIEHSQLDATSPTLHTMFFYRVHLQLFIDPAREKNQSDEGVSHICCSESPIPPNLHR